MLFIFFSTFVLWSLNSYFLNAVPVLPLLNKSDKREVCAERVNAISSNIAMKAAEEAHAAVSSQFPAASRASHQVKEQLAEKAIEAAKAAQAALAGKVALVEELTREKEATRCVLQEEVNSKYQIEKAMNKEMKAIAQIRSLLNVLNTGLRLAQTTADNADMTLRGVREDLREKTILLTQALHAVEILTREEALARNDLETTKFAARKAVACAAAAKANVCRGKRESELKAAEQQKNV